MARLEEPLQEHAQPVLDGLERVLVAALLRDQVGPGSVVAIVPRVVSEEGDLARPVTEAHRVVEEEVVQLVGADDALGVGARTVRTAVGRDQLGADLGLEHGAQRLAHLRRVLLRIDRPADQELDQRLRHRGVDGIVRHLVADAVGGPAERELAEVAGAHHDRAMLVGEPEQV